LRTYAFDPEVPLSDKRAANEPVLTTALCTVAVPSPPSCGGLHAEKSPDSNPSLKTTVGAAEAADVAQQAMIAAASPAAAYVVTTFDSREPSLDSRAPCDRAIDSWSPPSQKNCRPI
jgi:hypothetical protein